MNDAQKAHFKTLIEARLAELAEANAIGQEGQSVVTLDQQAVGRLSRMDALQSQAMAQASQGRRDVQERRLNAALARLAAGEFGYCEDCGDEIAKGRLEFDPAAHLCISCAQG